MQFTKNFTTDFDLLAAGITHPQDTLPFAFARYGDGEWAVMSGRCHRAKSDHWEWRGQQPKLSDRLRQTIEYTAMGWHVGIVAESHDAPSHQPLLDACRLSYDQITFGEIFNFSNYKRFRALPLRSCFWVGPRKCDLHVPEDAVLTGWDWLPVVKYLIQRVRQPIIVAAGPMANVIIHEYWRATENMPSVRQTIIDVGSGLAEFIHDRRTRRFHNPGHHLHNWSPTWKLSELTERERRA
jgi:hypothetical protein